MFVILLSLLTACLISSPPVAFNVYDVDRDGFISNGELFLVLKMMVGNNLKVVPIFLQMYYSDDHPGPAATANCR